jgi:hypothetical protein
MTNARQIVNTGLVVITDDERLGRTFGGGNRRALWLLAEDGVVILVDRRGAADACGLAFISCETLLFETSLAAALVAVPEYEE